MRGPAGLRIIALLSLILAVLALAVAGKAVRELNRVQSYVDDVVFDAVRQAEEDAERQIRDAIRELEDELERREDNLCRDVNVRSVAHRGVSASAPENTLPAFRLAAERGFSCVETDIRFTADGVPVCLHDSSIDRTGNGSGILSYMTFEEVRQYDFGAWKGEEYAGTGIPSFEEFLELCKNLGLHPYIELKEGTTGQIRGLVETVERYGMKGKVSWISFDISLLSDVRWADDEARLGYLVSEADTGSIYEISALRSGKNEVFLDTSACSQKLIDACREANLPLEVWTINDEALLETLDPYVTGVTSDCLKYGQYLYQKGMNHSAGV